MYSHTHNYSYSYMTHDVMVLLGGNTREKPWALT